MVIKNILFHKGDAGDLTKYNSWNFSDPYVWDGTNYEGEGGSFWFNQNTTFLGDTNNYEVGREKIRIMSLPVQPEKNILINQNVTSSIFGIPMSSSNIE